MTQIKSKLTLLAATLAIVAAYAVVALMPASSVATSCGISIEGPCPSSGKHVPKKCKKKHGADRKKCIKKHRH